MKAFRYLTALGLGAAVSLTEAASAPRAEAQTIDSAETTALVAANLVPEAQVEAVAAEHTAASSVAQQAQTSEDPLAEAPATDVAQVTEQPDAENLTVLDDAAVDLEAVTDAGVEAVTDATETANEAEEAIEIAVDEAPAADERLDEMPQLDTPQLDAPQLDAVDTAQVDVTEAEAVRAEADQAEVAQADESVDLAQTPEDAVEGTVDPIEQEFLEESTPLPTVPTESATPEVVPTPEVAPPQDGAIDAAPKGTSLIDTQPNLLRPTNSSAVVVDTAELITLEQAIEIARQNSPTIRIRQLEVERAQAAVDQAKSALSPQIATNSGLTQTGTAVRSQEVYNETNDVANGNADIKRRTQTTTLSGNVRLDYNIIQPGRRAQIRAAEKQKEQAELTLNQDLAQLRLDVSSDYYAVQEADEQVKISASAVESAQKSLQDAEALERAGVGTRFAVLQAEVQLANEEQNRINAISSQNQTRRVLAQRLSIPENFGVASADNVQAAGEWTRSLEESIILAYQNRVELDSQLLGREISDAQREAALAGNRPTLGLFAQVGPQYSFQDERTKDNDDSDVDSRRGIRNGQLGYTVGLQFNWRFFDGGGTRASARQQEINKAIAEEQFESIRDGVRQQVENAFYSLQANFNNISTAKKGVQQAASALRLARLRFQAGVGTQSEVVDAERDLTTARGNEVTAILNYNRALVQMRRAVGETLVAPAYESPVYQEASNSDR